VRRDSLSEAARSVLGFCSVRRCLIRASSFGGVCTGSLSPAGISICVKCWYVCVMEMCLGRQVLSTYCW